MDVYTTFTKINLEKALSGNALLIIELGCGRKKKGGRITIDKVDLPGVDIVADLEEGAGFFARSIRG